MEKGQALIIVESAAGAKALKAFLAAQGLENICSVLSPQEAGSVSGARIWVGRADSPVHPGIAGVDIFHVPVRAGVLLERVHRHLRQNRESVSHSIGHYRLDVQSGTLKSERTEQVIRLTDKEKSILLVLAEAGGKTVERRALLEAAWGYGEGVETHTLETHIYRLRQKIEKDPAAPEILLTTDAGYRLAV